MNLVLFIVEQTETGFHAKAIGSDLSTSAETVSELKYNMHECANLHNTDHVNVAFVFKNNVLYV